MSQDYCVSISRFIPYVQIMFIHFCQSDVTFTDFFETDLLIIFRDTVSIQLFLE
jgi:hypothetical protein